MAFAPHFHDWHWTHDVGRALHRHVVAAWVITIAAIGAAGALAVWLHRGGPSATFEEETIVSSPTASGHAGQPVTVLEQSLMQSETLLAQTGAASAKLQVAHRAWDLAQALPVRRNAEYRPLLLRAKELFTDPQVIDIMEKDDRILKARVIVELAPVIEVIGTPGRDLA